MRLKTDNSTKTPEEGSNREKDDKVKMLLEKDNQVRQALQLLKSWSVFSKIQPGA